ncbi:MAG: relaxase [Acidobacteria bacterium]|nr:MAG: relaxase [Acidobacteriota bacterium]
MSRRALRLPRAGRLYLDLFSGARMGPSESRGFSPVQIEQIRRTVRGRTPEVMVKVTGGGKKRGAVAAHFSYISQHGELEIETDRGERVTEDDQKALLKDWHLELIAGQYRGPSGTKAFARPVKLVHNIVLSMPSPTPADKVLAAARAFAREKFGAKHRYALVLHTHQHHPHVHLLVKAEREDGKGRLHINKAMLREWRQDFAQEMRRQGIAANATPRSVRGQTKRAAKDVFYRTQARGESYALREKLDDVVHGLTRTNPIADPARGKLLETRKAIIQGWNAVAERLEAQGEIVLGGDVRYFAMHLPPVLTDRERLTEEFMRFIRTERSARMRTDDRVRDHTLERTR